LATLFTDINATVCVDLGIS